MTHEAVTSYASNPALFDPTLQHPIQDQAAEQARRTELTNSILQASEGSVGLYTSVDLPNAEKDTMQATMTARNGGVQNPEAFQAASGGGWGNYGERRIAASNHDQFAEEVPFISQGELEDVHFFEMPDGTVDVRYAFTSAGYRDGSGRPGNALQVGYILPRDNAMALREALHYDPSYIIDITGQQVQALGISAKSWEKHIKPDPNGSFSRPFVYPKDRQLTIIDHDPYGAIERQTLQFGENKSIVPVTAEVVALPEPANTTEQAPDQSSEKIAAEAQQIVDSLIQSELTRAGGTVESTMRLLSQIASNSDKTPEAQASAYAAFSAYDRLLESGVENHGVNFATSRFMDAMYRYNQAYLDNGIDKAAIPNPYDNFYPETPSVDINAAALEMNQIGLFLSGLDNARQLTAHDFTKAMAYVRQRPR